MRRQTSFAFVIAGVIPLFPAPQPQAPPPQPPADAAPAPPAPVPDTRLAGRANGPLIGLSDNRPETIRDRRFQRSGIKRIRVLVPFDDVARGGRRRRIHDIWFDTAHAHGIEPLVSFYRSHR